MRTKKNENETRVVLRRSSYMPTGYAEYSASDVRCDHGVPLAHLCYQCETAYWLSRRSAPQSDAQQKMVRASEQPSLRPM